MFYNANEMEHACDTAACFLNTQSVHHIAHHEFDVAARRKSGVGIPHKHAREAPALDKFVQQRHAKEACAACHQVHGGRRGGGR